MKLVNQIIKPLSGTPLQAYLDNRIQLFDIIEKSFPRLVRLRFTFLPFPLPKNFFGKFFSSSEAGLLTKATMLTDLKASRKTVHLYTFISNVFDDVFLAENHSKVILIRNSRWMVSICTSQNQTRGNRTEEWDDNH